MDASALEPGEGIAATIAQRRAPDRDARRGQVRQGGGMTEIDTAEAKLRPANDNPWYCLATLHGEQPLDGFDRELAEKNRQSWNRWLGDMPEGDRTNFVSAFRRRTSKKLLPPERAGIPDFSQTYFDRYVSFNGFSFGPGANFTSSKFSKIADFASATFLDITDFSSVTFAKDADFRCASFSNMAQFNSVVFSDLAGFEATTFHHAAHFDAAIFSDGADFSHATFKQLSAFNSATFCGSTDFSSATFHGPIDFSSATFAREIHFVNAKLTGVTHFARAQFESRVPDFRGATLHEATEWHDVTWPGPPETKGDAQKQVYAYERLKQEMERLKKHEDEQKFFRRELRARRGIVRVFSGNWLLNLFYQISSHYGDSFSRPLLWLMASFAGGILVYTNAPLCNGHSMPLKLAARLSFANIFVFLPDKRELLALPEMIVCLSNWTAAISAVQSISGVVFLFLLGLALRNRFRMK
ncbi:pentapeptide repeat-containing protein [Bradyrhizobium sp. DASA03076]|uniref:pentapeptide repeat-containing protein n=1 Tax=Bradyrhizobium sp. BLXBL-03 TaxID=3395916 RepID=UPI003F716C2B